MPRLGEYSDKCLSLLPLLFQPPFSSFTATVASQGAGFGVFGLNGAPVSLQRGGVRSWTAARSKVTGDRFKFYKLMSGNRVGSSLPNFCMKTFNVCIF